jgi:signal transduction histidine kinase
VREWSAYQEQFDQLSREVFQPAFDDLAELVSSAAADARLLITREERVQRVLEGASSTARQTTRSATKETRQVLDEVANGVVSLTRESIRHVEGTVNEVLSELSRLDLSAMTETEAVEIQRRLQIRIDEVTERERALLDRARMQLQEVNYGHDLDGGEPTASEVLAAFEEEVLALREQHEADAELAQLGMAVGIISHEFDSSIRGVRRNLRRLREWAHVNEGLRDIYEDIASSFKHLDGYLTLFTPLQRRLYRTKTDIRGSRIKDYLDNIFSERLRRHEVRLVATDAFMQMCVEGYPSTFYPVFVNLVDNAIFWLSDAPEPKEIRLDAEGDSFIVSDTGPGIRPRDRESIFESGFTRKPGGRGMGLKISRDVLKGENFIIEASSPRSGGGAVFWIRPAGSASESEER